MSDQRDSEAFLFEEASLLDENRFADWLALFTETGWYWVPSQAGQESPVDNVSIIYDDRRLLETRVRRLCGETMHAGLPLPRTSRLIGNVAVTGAADGIVTVRSKFTMAEYRLERRRDFAGTLFHGLQSTGGGFQIAWKKVDLVDCEAAMEGITVPF